MANAASSASSTKETTNYGRLCRLLVDVGTQALRDTFDAVHAPPNLHTVLAGNKTTLQSLRRKKIINPTQWGKLFPAIPNSVLTAHFDTTLLMVLLRNICGFSSPVTGWDTFPAVTDMSREADIARVKYFRNTVYAHAEHASVDDVTFNAYWQDIRDTLVRLGGVKYRAAIDNLETECMDPEIEYHYKEVLSQWKKDEDNVKDKLNEIGNEIGKVMKKLDDLEAVAITFKEENSHEGKYAGPKEVQRGPVTCKEKYHENESVEYYCQECKVCICHKCSVMNHNHHNKMDIPQAAAERKTEMADVFEQAKFKIVHVERKRVEQMELMKKSEEELSTTEKMVTETVEEIVRVAREHESTIKKELTEIKEDRRRDYETKLKSFQLLASRLRSSVQYGEDVVQRDNGQEILEAGQVVIEDCERLLNTEEPKLYKSKHVTYHVNTEAINAAQHLIPGYVSTSPTDPSQCIVEVAGLKEAKLGAEANFTITTRDSDGKQCYGKMDKIVVKISSPAGKTEKKDVQDCKDGNYTVRYKPKSVGLHDVAVEVNGKPLTGSPWHVQVTPHQYKALHSFGSRGKGRGEFDGPYNIALSERTGNIAVADYNNKRVQLFDSECKYPLRTIGDKGTGAKKIGQPTSVAFTASGDVIVTHVEATQSHKMSVFTERGHFIKHISRDHLIDPRSVFVRADGHMIVCDGGDKTINVLSPDGMELRQSIRAPHCDDIPSFSCYYQDTFYVFYCGAHCVKAFNKEGAFLCDIGSKGSGDGQMIHPSGLTIDKFNNVIVCDRGNGRLLAFEKDGKFINSVNEGMKEPCSVTLTKEGQLLVCDFIKNCIRCFQ